MPSQFLTSLLRRRGGWFAHHALQPTPSRVGSSPVAVRASGGVWRMGVVGRHHVHRRANIQNRVRTQAIGESEVIAPSEMMAIGESDAFAFMRNPGYDFGGRLRHQEKVNVLFCDGHVESPTPKLYLKRRTTRLWSGGIGITNRIEIDYDAQ